MSSTMILSTALGWSGMIWYDALLVQHSPLSGAVLVQNSSLLLDMWPRVRDQVRAVINMFVYLLIPPPIALCFYINILSKCILNHSAQTFADFYYRVWGQNKPLTRPVVRKKLDTAFMEWSPGCAALLHFWHSLYGMEPRLCSSLTCVNAFKLSKVCLLPLYVGL